MKVLHVPYCYHPDPHGGTEVYVQALAGEQARLRLDAVIAAPASREDRYSAGGLEVYRFATGRPELRDLYGEGDREAASGFARVLEEAQPDLVHLHAFTSAVSVLLAREARSRAIPVVFTYHTPTVSCQRGTLLRWGTEICDGRLDARACARCALHGLGLPRPVSWAVGGLPASWGRMLGGLGAAGGAITALRMRELVECRHGALRALLAEVDHVVAVCGWAKDLLANIGVPAGKISLSRQGLAFQEPAGLPSGRRPGRDLPRKIAFLGRIHRVKGIDVLIDAIRMDPELRVELDVYGVIQGADGESLFRELSRLASSDPRVRFLKPVASAQVPATLARYDALAVPSQCLETGPLVVYEAFAAGIPVIGSDLGGIAEIVEHERNGLLVPAASPQAWLSALKRIVDAEDLLEHMRDAIMPPRNMRRVADEMTTLYTRLGRPAGCRSESAKKAKPDCASPGADASLSRRH